MEKDQLDEILSVFGSGLQHKEKQMSQLTLQAGNDRVSADL